MTPSLWQSRPVWMEEAWPLRLSQCHSVETLSNRHLGRLMPTSTETYWKTWVKWLPLCLPVHLSLSLSLSLTVRLCVCLLPLPLSPSLSLSLPLSPSLSLSLSLRLLICLCPISQHLSWFRTFIFTPSTELTPCLALSAGSVVVYVSLLYCWNWTAPQLLSGQLRACHGNPYGFVGSTLLCHYYAVALIGQ